MFPIQCSTSILGFKRSNVCLPPMSLEFDRYSDVLATSLILLIFTLKNVKGSFYLLEDLIVVLIFLNILEEEVWHL